MRTASRRSKQSATCTRAAFGWRDGQLTLAETSAPLRFVWSWPDIDRATLDPSTVTVSRGAATAGAAVPGLLESPGDR